MEQRSSRRGGSDRARAFGASTDVGEAKVRHGRVRERRPGGATEDELLLERPDPSFRDTDPWRAFRILSEFVEGFDALAGIPPAISVFGSARIPEDDPMYAQAREVGAKLAAEGFAVITGGGPGVMEAANRGCKEAGGYSIGCNIELPFEQSSNGYLDLEIDFSYFFARKTMFVKYAEGFICFPGGYGTFDELFEALTLIQTGKVQHFPLVLYGSEYWDGLLRWLEERVLGEGKIAPDDIRLFRVCDSPQEAIDHIRDVLSHATRVPADRLPAHVEPEKADAE